MATALGLDEFWHHLASETRHTTLRTLGRIVAQQIKTPPERREVYDERA
jgi:hypothetical protein